VVPESGALVKGEGVAVLGMGAMNEGVVREREVSRCRRLLAVTSCVDVTNCETAGEDEGRFGGADFADAASMFCWPSDVRCASTDEGWREIGLRSADAAQECESFRGVAGTL